MNKQERIELALEKHKSHHNCCQCSLAALGDLTGMSGGDLYKLGAGFAGGMGDANGVCGALVGAVMALGGATNAKGTVFKARELSQKFKEKCGAIICRELKGIDTGKMLCSCDDCIANAVEAYCEVTGIE